MAQHLTEEEQIETLKRWWADNGRSIVIGVVVALVGYFGWQGWQSQQQQARESASMLYEDLTQVVAGQPGANLGEQDRERAESIAEELKADYSGLLYASNGAMLMARVAVEAGDLDGAEQHLSWVVEQNHSEEIALLGRLRLAQVLYGKGDYEQALATLDIQQPGAFASAYAELRGDVLVAQEQPAEAVTAYQQALEELLPAQSNRRETIQMKMDDLQVAGGTPAAENNTGAESS
ncbi:YfgM family protein [Gilvimarinus sp. F26214L]|uniref:YfgM family protein n=1 Tax=Gilvimarinus sp. DZF01 TaxID=3461371 RepID=UPI004045211F